MGTRIGKNVIEFSEPPCVLAASSVAGKTESEGPLKAEFDRCYTDDGIGSSSWEAAESKLIKQAVDIVIDKSGLYQSDIDLILAGDLLNQCTASTYGLRDFGIAFAGLFGACSTMAYSMALASVLVDSKSFDNVIAATSSHFCSAEKQFRFPLEYGGQRAQTAQRTVTGGAACLIGRGFTDVVIKRVLFGKITDFGVTDAANMGAAMAPAAASSVSDFLMDTGTVPQDYDLILTGDLGSTGSELFAELMREDHQYDVSAMHKDCGNLIYSPDKQDVHSGGSGCACSGLVVCSYILNKIKKGELHRVLFAGTGALMSPTISLQGESIPGIAHIIELSGRDTDNGSEVNQN